MLKRSSTMLNFSPSSIANMKNRSLLSMTKFIYFVGFLDLFGVSMLLPLILPHAKSVVASHIIAGLVTSLYGGIQLFSSPLFGQWSDHIGRKPVLLTSLFVTSISYYLLGVSQSAFAFAFARILSGIFKHSLTISRAILVDITSFEDRSAVFGTFNAASSIGFIIGPLVGGHLAEIENGFTVVCFTAASIFIFNFVLCCLLLPSHSDNGANFRQSKQQKLKSTQRTVKLLNYITDIDWTLFWDLFLVRFLVSFSSLVYRTNFSLLIRENFGGTPKVVGYLMSFQGIVSAVAGFFTGQISKLYKNSLRELYHSCILLTVALFGLTFAPSLAIVIACLVPLCISSAVIRVSNSAVTISRSPREKIGSVTGFGQSVASLSRTITPLVAGISQEITVYGPGLVGTVSSLLGAILAGHMSQKSFKQKKL